MTPNMSTFRLFSLTFFVFLALSLNTASVYAQFDDSHIRAVDATAASCGDGETWNTAYRYLQDALQYASTHSEIDEIWIAAGTYYPDRDCANQGGTGDRDATYELVEGVALLGGFDGTELDADKRDPAANITVLSGDITNPWENCAPGTGDCFTVTPEIPGCDNLCNGEPCPGCCALVCADDPICCILEWDQLCAGGGCPPNS